MGNKIYKWYVADSINAEIYNSKHDTREDALAAANAEFGSDPFVLIEADKSVVAPIFSEDYVAEIIMEQLEENNPECWGEDGAVNAFGNGLPAVLREAVDKWLTANPPRTHAVDDMRTVESFNGART